MASAWSGLSACKGAVVIALFLVPQYYFVGSSPVILSNSQGMQVSILTTGATIQRLLVPNDRGVAEDVVLGFDDPRQYQVKFWHSTLTAFVVLHPTMSLNGIESCAPVWRQLLSSSTSVTADQQYPVFWRHRGPCGESHRQRQLQLGRAPLQLGRK